LFLSLIAVATPVSAQEVRRGEVIVEIKAGASIDAVNDRIGTTTLRRIYGTNFYRLRTPKGKKENKFRKRLARDVDVLSATLNPVISSPFTAFGRSLMGFPDGYAMPGKSQAEYTSQTQLIEMLNLTEVQVRSKGKGVVIAVIDTGVSKRHPDLNGHLWTDERANGEIRDNLIDDDADGLVDDYQGWDFVDSDKDADDLPGDPNTTVAGHGSFIAGLILLVAPEARIMPLRAFPADGMTDAFTVAECVKYAADHGANVINLSLGSPDASPLLQDAIDDARRRGIVVVAAVGNESSEAPPQFPSSSTEVMAVTAIDYTSRRAHFSNFGAHVDVSAPGVGLISVYPSASGPDYASWSGTSFAAPFASAEAALILASRPTNPDTKKTIEDSAVSIDDLNPGFGGKLGTGRLDPLSALRSLLIDPLPTDAANHAEVKLTSGALNPESYGKAQITVTTTMQEFEVEAYKLSVRALYRLFVDGQLAATSGTTNLGSLKFEFSTEPGHLPLPGFMNPVTGIKHVELRDAEGRIALQGDFATAGGPLPTPAVMKQTRLFSTGVLPGAAGQAEVEIEGAHQELDVRAEGLNTGTAYFITVDGINLGAFPAIAGFLRVEFASDGSGDSPLPPALIPVTGIGRVQVRNPAGVIVLQGDFQPGGDESTPGPGETGTPVEFRGLIERLPTSGLIGEWRVGGRLVRVFNSTIIKQERGAVAVGALVEVKGVQKADGSVDAGRIEVEAAASTPPEEVKKEIRLTRSGVDPDAEGKAGIEVSRDRDEMGVGASKLEPGSRYTIIVDGVSLGSFTTTPSGSLDLLWSSAPNSGLPLPSTIRPLTMVRHVEIRNAAGAVVLSGDLPS